MRGGRGRPFPVLKDADNRVADQLLAERTCEALVIDGRGRLRYRGAIDDQYGLGTRRDSPAHHYLVDAIEAVLAGREVSPADDPGRRLPDRAQGPAAGNGSLSTPRLAAETAAISHASIDQDRRHSRPVHR